MPLFKLQSLNINLLFHYTIARVYISKGPFKFKEPISYQVIYKSKDLLPRWAGSCPAAHPSVKPGVQSPGATRANRRFEKPRKSPKGQSTRSPRACPVAGPASLEREKDAARAKRKAQARWPS